MTYNENDDKSINDLVARKSKEYKRSAKSPSIDKENLYETTGLSDQTGARYVQIAKGDVITIGPLDLLTDEPSKFWRLIADQGLPVVTHATKGALGKDVEAIKEWPQKIYAATTPGFHREACVYLKPDGGLVGKNRVTELHVSLPNPWPLSQAGTFMAWKEGVRLHVRGQRKLILPLCLAFVGPLLDLMPSSENVGIELVGGDSIGKSKALDLFASVWGGIYGQEGSVAGDWNSTAFSIEAMILSLNHAAVGLNEGSHGSVSGAAGMEVLGRTIFALGDGSGKSRNGKQGPKGLKLALLSTANDSQDEAQPHRLSKVRKASGVRMITIEANECKGFGIYTSLPKGFSDSANAIDDLAVILAANNGWAIDQFLKKLVAARRPDESALKAEIEYHVRLFMRAVKKITSDSTAIRVGKKFAANYAAGKMASTWGILPLKSLREPILGCFRDWLASQSKLAAVALHSPSERLQAYVSANRARLIDLDLAGVPDLSIKALNRHPGFIRTVKGRRCILVRSSVWATIFAGDDRRALKVFDEQGVLIKAKDGKQYQLKLRKNAGHNRVYCVALAEI
jgi:hypothetical protein